MALLYYFIFTQYYHIATRYRRIIRKMRPHMVGQTLQVRLIKIIKPSITDIGYNLLE